MNTKDRRDGEDRRHDLQAQAQEQGQSMSPNITSHLINLGIPLIALALGSMTTWVWKIDDRQYQLSAELPSKYVTKEDLKGLIQEFGKTANFRFDLLEKLNRDERLERATQERDQRLDRENFQKQVLDEVKETNKNMQQLALKLAKITSNSQGE